MAPWHCVVTGICVAVIQSSPCTWSSAPSNLLLPQYPPLRWCHWAPLTAYSRHALCIGGGGGTQLFMVSKPLYPHQVPSPHSNHFSTATFSF